jgi:hypothetical protein
MTYANADKSRVRNDIGDCGAWFVGWLFGYLNQMNGSGHRCRFEVADLF